MILCNSRLWPIIVLRTPKSLRFLTLKQSKVAIIGFCVHILLNIIKVLKSNNFYRS